MTNPYKPTPLESRFAGFPIGRRAIMVHATASLAALCVSIALISVVIYSNRWEIRDGQVEIRVDSSSSTSGSGDPITSQHFLSFPAIAAVFMALTLSLSFVAFANGVVFLLGRILRRTRFAASSRTP